MIFKYHEIINLLLIFQGFVTLYIKYMITVIKSDQSNGNQKILQSRDRWEMCI